MKKMFSFQAPAKPVPGSPAMVPHPLPVSEEKPVAASSSGVDPDWERRIKEVNEKFLKFHEEREIRGRRAEAVEKAKTEFQQQLEEEKKKSGEIAKTCEDLREEIRKYEALARDGEERRLALAEKVRELETNLAQKTSAVEQEIRQKEDLARQSEKAAAEAQHEISTLRSREQELSRKIEGLERNVQTMTESLRFRDGVLAQFEKQILELAEMPPPSKTGPGENRS